VLYAEIERFWKNGRKKEGPFFLMWGLFRAKNTRMALLVTWGTGLRGSEIRMPCCPRSVDATWRRTNLRSSLPSSIAPGKVGCLYCFAVLPSNFKRPYLFKRLADLGEFYVESKGFPCSTRKLSDFGRMDEKKRGLSSSCGAFSGLKIPGMALLVTWGTGLRAERDSYAMLSSFGRCYMGRTNLRSSLPSSIAQAKLAVCAVFRCFALQLQKAISFNGLADLGEFYVKSKGFPCSTRKSSDFGRMDEKRGGLSSSCGAFSGLKIQEWHCS